MSFISRILLHNLSLFKLNNEAGNLIQKLLLSKAHYLCSNHPKVGIAPKDNSLNTVKRFFYEKRYSKNVTRNTNEVGNITKLHRVNLPLIVKNGKNLPPQLLIATFQKICFIYHNNKDRPYFHKELNYFTRSETFQSFCKILQDKLLFFTPSYLGCLLEVVNFNVSPESTMMRKIYTLLLDNINCFPIFDLITLYCQLQEKHFRDIPECKSILEGCEKYFENHLEADLSCGYYDVKEMTNLISEKNVPLNIKRLLTEKCISLINLNHYPLTVIPAFLLLSFEEPLFSLYKKELLDMFKLILDTHRLPRVQEIFSQIYKKIVYKNEAAYDEEICKKFINNMNYFYTDRAFIITLNQLCEIGHHDQQSIEKVADLFMTVNLDSLIPSTVLYLVSIVVEVQIHKNLSNHHWSQTKTQLESYDASKYFSKLSDTFLWCEYLSFLGCDTTPLISQILNNAEEISETSENSRAILRLYHVAKKYYPESNLEFSKKLLAKCLDNSVYEKNFYESSHVHKFFGGKEYVLEDCLSSDYIFLPMVVVLGPDNKPIDLSRYNYKDKIQLRRKSFNVTVNIEHIEKPPGSKVIAFVDYLSSRPFKYRNAPITSGYLQVFLKPYEGLNCHIIPLPRRYFFFKDNEKMKFLSTEVNKIIESSETMSVKNEM